MTDFDIGDPVTISGQFVNADGDLADPTALELKVRPPGFAGVNETQRLTGNATGGTFTLSFDGQGPTAAIDFDSSAGEIQVALEALSNIAPGDLLVTGGPVHQFPVRIEFTGAHALAAKPTLVVGAGSLTGGTVTAFTDVEGVAPSTVTHTWPPDDVIVKDETGQFHAVITPDRSGAWDYRWKATGVAAGAEPGRFLVRPEFLEGAWRPSVADVAALLRTRTRDAGGMDGGEIGTFTAETRPTAAQVESLIGQALSDVEMRVGAVIPASLHASAKHVATLRAANLVEISYLPEQTGEQASVYQSIRLTYEEAVKTLSMNAQWLALGERVV